MRLLQLWHLSTMQCIRCKHFGCRKELGSVESPGEAASQVPQCAQSLASIQELHNCSVTGFGFSGQAVAVGKPCSVKQDGGLSQVYGALTVGRVSLWSIKQHPVGRLHLRMQTSFARR